MKTNLPLSCFLTLFISTAAGAADLDTLITGCNDCHGKDGISTDEDIPIIAGQSYVVLEDALIAFGENSQPCKESEYRHGDTSRAATTMCEIAGGLSGDDIEAISEHYSDLPFVAVKQDFDADLASKGAAIHERYCEKCHSEGGSLAEDDAGILAGQWTAYLRSSIDEFMNGERPMSKAMGKKMKRVEEGGLEALLHYYASEGQ